MIHNYEKLMWMCNLSYVGCEIQEFIHKGHKYFAMDSLLNIFDVIISFNWVALFLIRVKPEMFQSDYFEQSELPWTVSDAEKDNFTDEQFYFRTYQANHNTAVTQASHQQTLGHTDAPSVR